MNSLYSNKKIVYAMINRMKEYNENEILYFCFNSDAAPVLSYNTMEYINMIEEDIVLRANNNLMRIADEIWVFGKVSEEMLSDLDYAMHVKKRIRFFSISGSIQEIDISDIEFDNIDENEDELKKWLAEYSYRINARS